MREGLLQMELAIIVPGIVWKRLEWSASGHAKHGCLFEVRSVWGAKMQAPILNTQWRCRKTVQICNLPFGALSLSSEYRLVNKFRSAAFGTQLLDSLPSPVLSSTLSTQVSCCASGFWLPIGYAYKASGVAVSDGKGILDPPSPGNAAVCM